MMDRGYVEKAAHAGVSKVSLLQVDPFRYLLRAVGAGMGLTLVVFVFWVLKQNLHESAMGPVIASAFFGVGLMIIVFTNTELFTSNNMYLTVSSTEGRTSWREATLLWISAILVISLALSCFPVFRRGWLPRPTAPQSRTFRWRLVRSAPNRERHIFQRRSGQLDCLSGGADSAALPGGSCQNPGPYSYRLHLRLPGFELSIANMGTFSMAFLGGGSLTMGEALHNLFYSTVGNVVGGVLLVGLPFAYLNPREREEQMVRVD